MRQRCGPRWTILLILAVALWAAPAAALPFSSGSTGANGAFPPAELPGGTTSMTLDMATGVVRFLPDGTTVTLPGTPGAGFADGILNFTTVTVPAGVTLRFLPNAANTPVVILAQGDVTIAGTLDVSGANGGALGGLFGGAGGPGGFRGGNGQSIRNPLPAGAGQGPGGGRGGYYRGGCDAAGGSGGGFGIAGGRGESAAADSEGGAYGTLAMLPLIGGSGGGGGASQNFGADVGFRVGAGGGGGGGAILIASSGTITVSGSILANGGAGGAGAAGGSGGAVRLVAAGIAGTGTIRAAGGSNGGGNSLASCRYVDSGADGGFGRIRLEASSLTFPTVNATPGVISFVMNPRQVFIPNQPALRIVSVNGVEIPPNPVGFLGRVDVTVPLPGRYPVVIAASRVPVGTTVSVIAKPDTENAVVGPITSPTLAGTFEASQTTVDIAFPAGGVYFIEARATFSP